MAFSGQALIDRRCRLTIANPVTTFGNFADFEIADVIEINGGQTDDTDVPGMRVQFKIDKTSDKEPNTSQVTVTNLSPARRSSLQKKGVRVLLEAGYKATGVFKVFSGDVRTVDHVRVDSDWETVMKLGDGERAWRYARVNESFSGGTRAGDVVKKVGRSLGVSLGNLDTQAALINRVFDQGYIVTGSAARAFDKLMSSLGLKWSLQDGQIQVLKPDEVLDLPVPLISPTTGLIGSPEMGTPLAKGKPALLKFKSLLILVKCGAKVNLQSARYPNAFVKIKKCSFTGDTHGGPWYTDMEGVIV